MVSDDLERVFQFIYCQYLEKYYTYCLH